MLSIYIDGAAIKLDSLDSINALKISAWVHELKFNAGDVTSVIHELEFDFYTMA